MKGLRWTIVALIGIIILLAVGVLAGRVGGIAIRKQGAVADVLQLQLSEPVVRGVPVVVRWEPAAIVSAPQVILAWRDSDATYVLGEVEFAAGEATLTFPCEAVDVAGSLVFRSADDNKVVGTRLVELAPPGPECVQ